MEPTGEYITAYKAIPNGNVVHTFDTNDTNRNYGISKKDIESVLLDNDISIIKLHVAKKDIVRITEKGEIILSEPCCWRNYIPVV